MKTRSSFRRGFTLIEMIITLCIFILLTSAVFSLFDATLQSASSLQDNQAQSDQDEAMGAWLKNTFLDLPPNAQIISLRREGVPFDVSDLVWGNAENMSGLDLHLQANGLYILRLATSSAESGLFGTPDQTAVSEFLRKVLNDALLDVADDRTSSFAPSPPPSTPAAASDEG